MGITKEKKKTVKELSMDELKKELKTSRELNESLQDKLNFLTENSAVTRLNGILKMAQHTLRAIRAKTDNPEYANALKTLGVETIDSLKELKIAYKAQAKNSHPDKGGSNEAFRAVAKANEIIKKRLEGMVQ